MCIVNIANHTVMFVFLENPYFLAGREVVSSIREATFIALFISSRFDKASQSQFFDSRLYEKTKFSDLTFQI